MTKSRRWGRTLAMMLLAGVSMPALAQQAPDPFSQQGLFFTLQQITPKDIWNRYKSADWNILSAALAAGFSDPAQRDYDLRTWQVAPDELNSFVYYQHPGIDRADASTVATALRSRLPAAVLYSEPGRIRDPASWRTPEYKAGWGLEAIHAAEAYACGFTGKGVQGRRA